MISDVTEQDFQQKVVERSKQVPVVVDFWAEWCGPCRTLGPALEKAVSARNGEIELAKLDTDRNPNIAQEFQIASIPAVKAFKDGKVVAEFIGAIPPARIEAFLNEIVPSEADRLADADDEESLRKALEIDPRQASAAIKLGRLLLERGETDEAIETLRPFPHDFVADGLAARAELSAGENGSSPDELQEAFSAWDRGDPEDGAREAPDRAVVRAGQQAKGPAPPGDGRDLHRARRRSSAGAGAPPPTRVGAQLVKPLKPPHCMEGGDRCASVHEVVTGLPGPDL